MISIITAAANAILGLSISAVKAFFSMLTWFLKLFFKLIKYLYCVLPATAIVFVALFALNTYLLISGINKIPTDAVANQKIEATAEDIIATGNAQVEYFHKELMNWWKAEIYKYNGTVQYILLLVLSLILLIPVASVLLCITVFVSYGKLLFYAAIVDAVIYIVFAVSGRSAVSVIQNRLYKLVPEIGKRKFNKEYEEWRKDRKAAAAAAAEENRRAKADKYYGGGREDRYRDEDAFDELPYEDDEYDEEYDEEYDDPEYDDYEDEYEEDDEYDDEYEGGGFGGYGREPEVAMAGAQGFNFFAGCNSRESAERKYKSLVKLYHPDNMDGDTGALQEINVQYDRVKKRFS
ncbi:MAG: hypothetical protein J5802_01190 [Butyrivibrio sp.]|nr:hypothetical protein [Butyrivibrio sp.]